MCSVWGPSVGPSVGRPGSLWVRLGVDLGSTGGSIDLRRRRSRRRGSVGSIPVDLGSTHAARGCDSKHARTRQRAILGVRARGSRRCHGVGHAGARAAAVAAAAPAMPRPRRVPAERGGALVLRGRRARSGVGGGAVGSLAQLREGPAPLLEPPRAILGGISGASAELRRARLSPTKERPDGVCAWTRKISTPSRPLIEPGSTSDPPQMNPEWTPDGPHMDPRWNPKWTPNGHLMDPASRPPK